MEKQLNDGACFFTKTQRPKANMAIIKWKIYRRTSIYNKRRGEEPNTCKLMRANKTFTQQRAHAHARTHTHAHTRTHTRTHTHTHTTFASVAGSACRRDREASACMCCFASVLGILSSLIWEVQGYLAHCTVRQITTVPSGRRFSRSVLSSQRALNVRAAPMPTRTSWVKF